MLMSARDTRLYRCVLVQTYHLTAETLESAKDGSRKALESSQFGHASLWKRLQASLIV